MPKPDDPRSNEPETEDELVQKLVPAPAGEADALFLVGFLGKSSQADHTRLYLNPELSEYVEFRSDAVRHVQSLAGPESPLGGSAVWVDRRASLYFRKVVSREVQAGFLQGAISREFLPSASRNITGGVLGLLAGQRFKSIPPVASVCFSCPTEGGEDTCVPATCTLSTSCATRFLCF